MTATTTGAPPRARSLHLGAALAVLACAQLIIALDLNIVFVALPQIGRRARLQRPDAAMGRRRLHRLHRRLPAARRPRGRPARPPPRVRLRICCCTPAPRSPAASPARRGDRRGARGAGDRRRAAVPGDAVAGDDAVRGGPGAQSRARGLGRRGRQRALARRAARRRADRRSSAGAPSSSSTSRSPVSSRWRRWRRSRPTGRACAAAASTCRARRPRPAA